MLRTIRRVAAAAAGAVAFTIAVAGGASAGTDPAFMESAIRVNTQNQADATEASLDANATSGDVTCMNPVVVGGPAMVAARIVVGETYGTDFAQATGHCLSYQGNGQAEVKVWLEYQPYEGAPFAPVPGCGYAAASNTSLAGVTVIATQVITCQYRYSDAAAGKPHRAHATLTHSARPGHVYHGYSEVWLESTHLVADATTTTSP